MSVRAQCLVMMGRWTTAAGAADALLDNDPEFLKERENARAKMNIQLHLDVRYADNVGSFNSLSKQKIK